MKTLLITLSILLGFIEGATAKRGDFYQIQIYHLTGAGQEQAMDKYLQNAYLPALHRAGIKTVGVFKPISSDTTSGKRITLWIPLSSPNQLDKLQQQLANDLTYQTAGAEFLKAPFDQAPFLRKESILLKAFSDAPHFAVTKFTTKPSERIYELRSYEGPTEYLFKQKVKMFNEGGEIKLFKSLDFNALFYGEVISGSAMPNLMYLTTHENMAAHDAHWEAFKNAPVWKKLSALEEYKHTVSKINIMLLFPTDYSDF
jgi:NIPSNAP